ncbi:TolC family protein, partial [Rubrivivax gelatinosus]|uniref:TolC family protein n=1 Tax=Rubrivivax gelatinosus TaxID=28068 RepID=UPI001ED94EE8
MRSGERYSRQLSAGLDASWEPDFFGVNASTTAAAEADLAAAGATLQATRLTVAAETATAYLQWQGTRESVDSQAQTLQLVQWRLQAGLANAVDAEQARANLEQTRAQLPALQTTLQQTENALAILLGQPPATLGARLAD